MLYFYIKALHIISFVCWFAGLFYLVRLFVYHVEAKEKDEQAKIILKKQFTIMERRLWHGITVPSMIATLVFGIWLVYLSNAWKVPWFYIKILIVFLLVHYHHICGRIMKSLHKDEITWTSKRLRLWNEVATILLVAIVFLAVLKQVKLFAWGMLGFAVFAAVLVGIILYRRKKHA